MMPAEDRKTTPRRSREGTLEGLRNRRKPLMGAGRKAEEAFMCRMWTTR